jgi:hypothetical protein
VQGLGVWGQSGGWRLEHSSKLGFCWQGRYLQSRAHWTGLQPTLQTVVGGKIEQGGCGDVAGNCIALCLFCPNQSLLLANEPLVDLLMVGEREHERERLRAPSSWALDRGMRHTIRLLISGPRGQCLKVREFSGRGFWMSCLYQEPRAVVECSGCNRTLDHTVLEWACGVNGNDDGFVTQSVSTSADSCPSRNAFSILQQTLSALHTIC